MPRKAICDNLPGCKGINWAYPRAQGYGECSFFCSSWSSGQVWQACLILLSRTARGELPPREISTSGGPWNRLQMSIISQQVSRIPIFQI